MSSILDALKKLEKEKIHRNEVSTAIASDILRSGSKTRGPQWKIPLALFLVVTVMSGIAFSLFSEPTPLTDTESSKRPAIVVVESTKPKTVKNSTALPLSNPLPADLPLLSGIVFQQQKEARMAILNDLPVMEGTIVAGYTLQEIFPTHVILTQNGQSFSVPLNPHN